MGPDPSGPAGFLPLDSSHDLILLFKTVELEFSVLCSWNILAEPSIEKFLEFIFSHSCENFDPSTHESFLLVWYSQAPEEGGEEERDIKWLQGGQCKFC